MLRVTCTPVAVDLVAMEHCPVLLEPVRVCLQVADALKEEVLLLRGVAEVLDNLIFRTHCT